MLVIALTTGMLCTAGFQGLGVHEQLLFHL